MGGPLPGDNEFTQKNFFIVVHPYIWNVEKNYFQLCYFSIYVSDCVSEFRYPRYSIQMKIELKVRPCAKMFIFPMRRMDYVLVGFLAPSLQVKKCKIIQKYLFNN